MGGPATGGLGNGPALLSRSQRNGVVGSPVGMREPDPKLHGYSSSPRRASAGAQMHPALVRPPDLAAHSSPAPALAVPQSLRMPFGLDPTTPERSLSQRLPLEALK